MSLLKALGIDKYTTKFKQWIRDKFIAKGGLKTINGESIEGDGDIEIKGGADSYEDIYIIEDFTAKDIESFEEGSLQIDGQGLSEAINNNKKIYIKYTNLASEPGMILCTTYKEDLYYISFRLNSSIYGFDIGEDSQHIDKNSIFKTDIQEQLESGKNIKTINGESLIGEGNIEISGGGSSVNANWNASEGESGHIYNRTHYSNIFNKSIIYDENSNGSTVSFDIDVSNGVVIRDTDLAVFIINISTSLGGTSVFISKEQFIEIKAGNAVLVTANFPNESVDLYVSYRDYYDSTKHEAIISINGAVYGTYQLVCFLTKQLDEAFIPDTIARKSDIVTPDLGIDPVVIKYLANPYIIEDMTKVPTELLNDEDGYKYMNPNMYLLKQNDYIYTAEYFDINFIHFNNGSEVYIDNGEWSVV